MAGKSLLSLTEAANGNGGQNLSYCPHPRAPMANAYICSAWSKCAPRRENWKKATKKCWSCTEFNKHKMST